MFVCPFPTDPKNWKIRVSLAFFFFLILNFAFLNKKAKAMRSKVLDLRPNIFQMT